VGFLRFNAKKTEEGRKDSGSIHWELSEERVGIGRGEGEKSEGMLKGFQLFLSCFEG
jgi:hypothetical protein